MKMLKLQKNMYHHQISDGKRNTKFKSTKEMRKYYESEAFESKLKQLDEEAKSLKAKKEKIQELVDVKNEAELQAPELTAIQKKEIYACRSNFKILVVDDCLDMQEVIVEHLKDVCGFINVDVADNAAHALERVSNKEYDLILCDFDMPIMNGYLLYKELKNTNFSNNFIMISGYCETQLGHLKSAGVCCLPKCGAINFLDNVKKISIGYYLRKLNKSIKESL